MAEETVGREAGPDTLVTQAVDFGTGDEPVVDTSATQEVVGDAGKEGQPSQEAEKPAEPEESPKAEALARSLRAVTAERNRLKRELADRTVETPSPRQQTKRTSAEDMLAGITEDGFADGKMKNAELVGIKYDPRDETFEIAENRWVSEREALAVVRAERLYEQQAETAEQVAQSRLQTVHQSMLDDIETTAAKYLPNVPKEALDIVTAGLGNIVGRELASAGVNISDIDGLPDDLPDIFGNALKTGLKEMRQKIAALQRGQQEANEEAAKTAPLASGGRAAGEPTKSLADMKPEERESYFAGLQKRVFAKFGVTE